MTLAPRQKLLAAAALALALPLLAVSQGMTAPGAARLVLGLASLAGLGWWWHRQSSATPAFQVAPRLSVVQRVGLSARTGLALVEIDGRPWVIVHGEGFATLQPSRTGPEVLP